MKFGKINHRKIIKSLLLGVTCIFVIFILIYVTALWYLQSLLKNEVQLGDVKISISKIVSDYGFLSMESKLENLQISYGTYTLLFPKAHLKINQYTFKVSSPKGTLQAPDYNIKNANVNAVTLSSYTWRLSALEGNQFNLDVFVENGDFIYDHVQYQVQALGVAFIDAKQTLFELEIDKLICKKYRLKVVFNSIGGDLILNDKVDWYDTKLSVKAITSVINHEDENHSLYLFNTQIDLSQKEQLAGKMTFEKGIYESEISSAKSKLLLELEGSELNFEQQKHSYWDWAKIESSLGKVHYADLYNQYDFTFEKVLLHQAHQAKSSTSLLSVPISLIAKDMQLVKTSNQKEDRSYLKQLDIKYEFQINQKLEQNILYLIQEFSRYQPEQFRQQLLKQRFLSKDFSFKAKAGSFIQDKTKTTIDLMDIVFKPSIIGKKGNSDLHFTFNNFIFENPTENFSFKKIDWDSTTSHIYKDFASAIRLIILPTSNNVEKFYSSDSKVKAYLDRLKLKAKIEIEALKWEFENEGAKSRKNSVFLSYGKIALQKNKHEVWDQITVEGQKGMYDTPLQSIKFGNFIFNQLHQIMPSTNKTKIPITLNATDIEVFYGDKNEKFGGSLKKLDINYQFLIGRNIYSNFLFLFKAFKQSDLAGYYKTIKKLDFDPHYFDISAQNLKWNTRKSNVDGKSISFHLIPKLNNLDEFFRLKINVKQISVKNQDFKLQLRTGDLDNLILHKPKDFIELLKAIDYNTQSIQSFSYRPGTPLKNYLDIVHINTGIKFNSLKYNDLVGAQVVRLESGDVLVKKENHEHWDQIKFSLKKGFYQKQSDANNSTYQFSQVHFNHKQIRQNSRLIIPISILINQFKVNKQNNSGQPLHSNHNGTLEELYFAYQIELDSKNNSVLDLYQQYTSNNIPGFIKFLKKHQFEGKSLMLDVEKMVLSANAQNVQLDTFKVKVGQFALNRDPIVLSCNMGSFAYSDQLHNKIEIDNGYWDGNYLYNFEKFVLLYQTIKNKDLSLLTNNEIRKLAVNHLQSFQTNTKVGLDGIHVKVRQADKFQKPGAGNFNHFSAGNVQFSFAKTKPHSWGNLEVQLHKSTFKGANQKNIVLKLLNISQKDIPIINNRFELPLKIDLKSLIYSDKGHKLEPALKISSLAFDYRMGIDIEQNQTPLAFLFYLSDLPPPELVQVLRKYHFKSYPLSFHLSEFKLKDAVQKINLDVIKYDLKAFGIDDTPIDSRLSVLKFNWKNHSDQLALGKLLWTVNRSRNFKKFQGIIKELYSDPAEEKYKLKNIDDIIEFAQRNLISFYKHLLFKTESNRDNHDKSFDIKASYFKQVKVKNKIELENITVHASPLLLSKILPATLIEKSQSQHVFKMKRAAFDFYKENHSLWDHVAVQMKGLIFPDFLGYGKFTWDDINVKQSHHIDDKKRLEVKIDVLSNGFLYKNKIKKSPISQFQLQHFDFAYNFNLDGDEETNIISLISSAVEKSFLEYSEELIKKNLINSKFDFILSKGLAQGPDFSLNIGALKTLIKPFKINKRPLEVIVQISDSDLKNYGNFIKIKDVQFNNSISHSKHKLFKYLRYITENTHLNNKKIALNQKMLFKDYYNDLKIDSITKINGFNVHYHPMNLVGDGKDYLELFRYSFLEDPNIVDSKIKSNFDLKIGTAQAKFQKNNHHLWDNLHLHFSKVSLPMKPVQKGQIEFESLQLSVKHLPLKNNRINIPVILKFKNLSRIARDPEPLTTNFDFVDLKTNIFFDDFNKNDILTIAKQLAILRFDNSIDYLRSNHLILKDLGIKISGLEIDHKNYMFSSDRLQVLLGELNMEQSKISMQSEIKNALYLDDKYQISAGNSIVKAKTVQNFEHLQHLLTELITQPAPIRQNIRADLILDYINTFQSAIEIKLDSLNLHRNNLHLYHIPKTDINIVSQSDNGNMNLKFMPKMAINIINKDTDFYPYSLFSKEIKFDFAVDINQVKTQKIRPYITEMPVETEKQNLVQINKKNLFFDGIKDFDDMIDQEDEEQSDQEWKEFVKKYNIYQSFKDSEAIISGHGNIKLHPNYHTSISFNGLLNQVLPVLIINNWEWEEDKKKERETIRKNAQVDAEEGEGSFLGGLKKYWNTFVESTSKLGSSIAAGTVLLFFEDDAFKSDVKTMQNDQSLYGGDKQEVEDFILDMFNWSLQTIGNNFFNPVRVKAINICKSPTIEQQHTITVLTQKSDIPFSNPSCEELYQYAKTLEGLDLSNSKITDLSPLTALSNLESLNLSNNLIADLKPLQYLRSLESLNLSLNPQLDFNTLPFMNFLTELIIDNCRIHDLKFLDTTKNLVSLSLQGNNITELTPINSLNLLRSLNLSNNQIYAVSPLSQLVQLRKLDLSNNQIDDVDALRYLIRLNELNLEKNNLANCTAKDLDELKEGKSCVH